MHKDMSCGMKTTIEIPTTAESFIGASAYRHGIVIMPPTSGTCTITFDGYDDDFEGIVLNTGDKPQTICACNYGNIVTKPWFIERSGGAPGTVNRLPYFTWRSCSKATAANIVLTQSGTAGTNLWLTTVNASCDGHTDTGEIWIDNGSSCVFSGWCNNQKHLNFYDPTGNQAGDGNTITATYYNSAATVNSSLYIGGYAILTTPTITYYELAEQPNGTNAGRNRPSQYN